MLREARSRRGEPTSDTREVNPGEVWEENELWIELSWRIDPDGSLGIRQFFESRERPGERLSVDEYYGWMFEHSVPGCREAAEAEGLTPLAYMRRHGSFEVAKGVGPLHETVVDPAELADRLVDEHGRVYTHTDLPPKVNFAPVAEPEGDGDGRRPVGVLVDGVVRQGFPTPSGRLEFYSRTLVDWGWPELAIPTYVPSHVHPRRLAEGQVPLISTFRLPTQIHTRSANSKWLDELAHTNPLWIHPSHAAAVGVETGDLVRVETDLGYYVVHAWVTEGIRPGVVACSHHMGRWRIEGHEEGHRLNTSVVALEHDGSRWRIAPRAAHGPFDSADPDTMRIWWTNVGVHQNMTFGVHPDPISGQHCWHQAVRISRARPGDHHGDVAVDTERSMEVYREWMARTRSARQVSPNGERRPHWLIRPLRPARAAYRIGGPTATRP